MFNDLPLHAFAVTLKWQSAISHLCAVGYQALGGRQLCPYAPTFIFMTFLERRP